MRMMPSLHTVPDFQVLFESAIGSYLVLLPDFTVIAASDAYLRTTKTKREDIIGRKVFETFSDGASDSKIIGLHDLRASLEQVLHNKTPHIMSVQKYDVHKPGADESSFEEHYWRPINSPILTLDNRVVYIIHHLEDVTEFAGLKMEVLGQLTGGMAHYFNNLLGIILGNIEMMEKETTPTGEEYRQLAMDAIARGAELVRALLAFSRQQPLNPAVIDVNAHLTNITKTLQQALGEHVEIAMKLDTNLWPVHVDAIQLETAVTNLAVNARNAMPQGGSLTITTRNVSLKDEGGSQHPDILPGDYVCIEVSDIGQGVPADVVAHVFEPFFTTKEVGRGMGLGLSMIYGFIKQSGGHIKIHSEIGHGTSVMIYFPRYEGEIKAMDMHDTGDTPAGHGETILVVEDNPDMRYMTSKQLESLGYKTIEAANGRQALEVIDGNVKCDLLFSDIVLPGGFSGFDIAGKVWKRDPSIRILLTSGFSDSMVHKRREITPGVRVEFLGKPYRKSDLARKVREVLGDFSHASSGQSAEEPGLRH